MNVSELRIGNILLDKYSQKVEVVEVSTSHVRVYKENLLGLSDRYDINEYSSNQFSKHLTPLKVSFFELESLDDLVRYSSGYYLWDGSIFSLEHINNSWRLMHASNDILIDIKYIHQLQNAYHLFTGKDLKLKKK